MRETSLPQTQHKKARRLPGGAVWLAAVSAVLWVLAVHSAPFEKMGAYGLVSLLGWQYFLGLTCLVVGFTWEVTRTPLHPKRLVAFIFLLIVFIYGTASAIEPIAALADSYLHMGFLQYIFVHGRIKPHFMADFSWPGSYSLGSVLVSFTGQANALAFLRFFPPFIELLYLAPLIVIARFSGVSQRTGWLGVAFYYASNWIDQDYFSPQALGYLFLLVVIAAVLVIWQPRPVATDWRFRRRLRDRFARSPDLSALSRVDGQDTFSTWTSSEEAGVVTASWQPTATKMTKAWHGLRQRYIQGRAVATIGRLEGNDTVSQLNHVQTFTVLGLLGLMCFTLAWCHQLTPYALMLMLFACLIARRLGRPELVIIAAIAPFAWLSLGASDYWIGHLNYIFGSFGELSGTLGSNVTSRVTGSVAHRVVADMRILLVGALFLLAGVGVLRRSTSSRVLELLVAAPILLLGAQNYVGEILMRTVLFGLPFTAILAASAFMPQRHGQVKSFIPFFPFGRYGRSVLRVVVVVVLLGFAVVTTVNRGGNDAYEAYSIGELEAVNYTYNNSKPGETMGMVVPYIPFGGRDAASVYFDGYDGGGRDPLKDTFHNFEIHPPTFVVLSQSQEAWGEIVAGYPKGWEAQLQRELVAKLYHVVAHYPTATVLGLRKVPRHPVVVGH